MNTHVTPHSGFGGGRLDRRRFLVLGLGLGLGGGWSRVSAADPLKIKGQKIFNGRDFTGWRQPVGDWRVAHQVTLDPRDPKQFVIGRGRGILVNGRQGRTLNLLTEQDFGDVEAHLEFVVPQGSNSGVYFQGRYEIQVFDSWGVAAPKHSDCGGIYERWKNDQGYEGRPPKVNASKRPGEWQSFDVIFRAPRFDGLGKKVAHARFVKVVHNGRVIHENVELTGPTRASQFDNEKPLGPLMLQGDHGPVAYRNLRLRSVEVI